MTDTPLTVSQIAASIKAALATGLPHKVHVAGEVSNLSNRSAAGHWFFSLKDTMATLRCVMFASATRRVPFEMRDGLEVIASGRIDLYDAQGSVQLYVDRLEPIGQGALELQLKRLIAELNQRGYFDPSRKMTLPSLPRRIAVLTSRNAAALQDVINTTRQLWPGCRLLLFDVRVQGAEAAPQIVNALRALSDQASDLADGIDAIILTRGGGSIEDLWAFNDRSVADAIYACRIPVVAAIGHETDTTLAELVADVRAATPTQAAMALVPDHGALEHQLSQLSSRMGLLTRRLFEQASYRLQAATRHPMLRCPEATLEPLRQRLDALESRLKPTLARRLETDIQRLEAIGRQLDALGPSRVLARGYSYTLGPNGQLLRRPDQVANGDRLITVLASGQVASHVEVPSQRQRQPASCQNEAPRLFEDS